MTKTAKIPTLFLIFFFLSVPAIALADSVPTVSIQPATANISSGSSIALAVDIGGVTDLYDWQFDVAFNPAVLSVTGITEGSFLSADGSTFFIPGTVDNVGGSVTFNGDTLLGPPPGVTGTGVLAMLDFTAIGVGSSPIDLANVILQDSLGNDIDFTIANGGVTVSGTSAVPEPSSLLMLGSGLLGLLATRSRKVLFP